MLLSLALSESNARAQQQLDSLSIHGWTKTTSNIPTTSDTLLSSFVPVLALDYERILSLNRWTYNAAYFADVFRSSGKRDHRSATGLTFMSRGSSILREDTRSLTAETINLFTAVTPLGYDWLRAKATVSGVTYHSGPPKRGSFFINDPNTQVDGFAIAGPMVNLDGYLFEAGGGVARQSNIVGGSYGSAYHLGASMPEETIAEEQLLTAEASFDERHFDLRDQLYRAGRARTSLRSTFEGNVTNELSAGYDLMLRDFFFTQGSDSAALIKQRRNETLLTFQDRLYYPLITAGTDLQMEINYSPRFVTRRSDAGSLPTNSAISSISTILLPNALNAYRFSLDGGLRYSNTWMNGLPLELSFRARYEEQDEAAELLTSEIRSTNTALIRRAEDILNEVSFNSGATQLVAGVSSSLHADHILGLQATGRIYRHSTPSRENNDDRDDQLFTLRAGHDWRWHPDVTASTELRMSQSHIVYLNASRSAQNSVTKSIALSHTSTYSTRSFFHRLTSEVYANYTVLDYFDRLPQLQSIGNYLLRGLNFRDSLLAPIGSATIFVPLELSFQSQLELRLNERGGYNEKNFTERRSLLITEAGGEIAIGLHPRKLTAPLSLHLGARAFLYTRSGGEALNSNWQEQERQWRLGPLVSLVLGGRDSPELYGAFWYAFITTTREMVQTLSSQTEAHLGVRFKL